MDEARMRVEHYERLDSHRRKALRFRRVFRWYLWIGIAVNLLCTFAFLIYGHVPWFNAIGFALLVAVLIHNEVWIERLR